MIEHGSLFVKRLLLIGLTLAVLSLPKGTPPEASGYDQAGALFTSTLLALQSTKLTAADGAQADYFGMAVAASDGVAVIGAPFAFIDNDPARGAAYIYTKSQNGHNRWEQVQKITAADGEENDYFGTAVAVSGDVVAVGAHAVDDYRGAVYVFQRDVGGTDNWGQVARLSEPDANALNEFGQSVAVSGDLVVVGAWHSMVGGNTDQGASYVFYRNQGGTDNWGLAAKLVASDGLPKAFFGKSVAVAGDTLVVGSPGAVVAGNSYQGAAYVYHRTEGSFDHWVEVAKLAVTDGGPSDWLGHSVSTAGKAVAVGAPGENVDTNADQGAVYVFARDQGGAESWRQTSRLVALDGMASDMFGDPVSVGDGMIAAAAHGRHVEGTGAQGAVYVYHRSQGEEVWRQVGKLLASEGVMGDEMGYSLSVAIPTILIGAPYATVDNNEGQGVTYSFEFYRSFLPFLY